jgi:hypothetical protein
LASAFIGQTGARPFARIARADAGFDDRHEEALRFARTGAGGDDKALLVPSDAEGLVLVAVEGEGLAVAAEDLGGFGKDDALGGKLVGA